MPASIAVKRVGSKNYDTECATRSVQVNFFVIHEVMHYEFIAIDGFH